MRFSFFNLGTSVSYPREYHAETRAGIFKNQNPTWPHVSNLLQIFWTFIEINIVTLLPWAMVTSGYLVLGFLYVSLWYYVVSFFSVKVGKSTFVLTIHDDICIFGLFKDVELRNLLWFKGLSEKCDTWVKYSMNRTSLKFGFHRYSTSYYIN